jgi:hypothetical protein
MDRGGNLSRAGLALRRKGANAVVFISQEQSIRRQFLTRSMTSGLRPLGFFPCFNSNSAGVDVAIGAEIKYKSCGKAIGAGEMANSHSVLILVTPTVHQS